MMQVMPVRCKVSVIRFFVDSIVDSIVFPRFVSALSTTVCRVLWSPDLTTRSNIEDSPRAVMLFSLCLQPLHPNMEALSHHIEYARIKLLALFYSHFYWVSIERKRTLAVRKSKPRWVIILREINRQSSTAFIPHLPEIWQTASYRRHTSLYTSEVITWKVAARNISNGTTAGKDA